MVHATYPIQVEGSQPDARLVLYLQDYTESLAIRERPLILICPGGAYAYTSDREAEPLALAFLAMGYHAAVLRYSCAPAKYPAALLELAKSVVLIRDHAAEWHVDADKIVVQGSSAGGHLAASLGMFWAEDFVAEGVGLTPVRREMLKPNGMMLCYPVITSGEFGHRETFQNLLGEREGELGVKMSLEGQVTERTPQAFIWSTCEDGAVPMENSLYLLSAMRKSGIPVEFHLYSRGGHGLGLANRLTRDAEGGAVCEACATWLGLAGTWLEQLFR